MDINALAEAVRKRKVPPVLENLLMSNPATGPAYSLMKAQEMDRLVFGGGPRGIGVAGAKTGEQLLKEAVGGKLSMDSLKRAGDIGWQRGAEATKRGYVPQGVVENVVAPLAESVTPLNVALANPEALAEAVKLRAGQAQAANYALGEAGLFGGPGAKHFPKEGQFSMLTDKMPRFEIDDAGARLNNNAYADALKPMFNEGSDIGATRLGTLLSHPNLYKQYPDLAEMNVILRKGGSGANFNGSEINLNGAVGMNAIDNAKPTLLHEIQHAIQEKEGFAKGGSPANFDLNNKYPMIQMDKESFLKQNAKSLSDKIDSIMESDYKDFLEGKLSAEDYTSKRQKLAKETGLSDIYNDIYYNRNRQEAYQRLAGEVEARDVSARMDMSPAQRASTQPLASQNIPLKEMIVRRDNPVSQALSQEPVDPLISALENVPSAPPPVSGAQELGSRSQLLNMKLSALDDLNKFPKASGHPEEQLALEQMIKDIDSHLTQSNPVTQAMSKDEEEAFINGLLEKIGKKPASKNVAAKFIGYQELGEGIPPQPLFNVVGEHPDAGSTFMPKSLAQRNIPMPEIPDFATWKKSPQARQIR